MLVHVVFLVNLYAESIFMVCTRSQNHFLSKTIVTLSYLLNVSSSPFLSFDIFSVWYLNF